MNSYNVSVPVKSVNKCSFVVLWQKSYRKLLHATKNEIVQNFFHVKNCIISHEVAFSIIFQELKSEIEDLETLRDEYVKRNTEQVSILIS